MSPECRADRLLTIADDVDRARHLVEAGWMAAAALTREEASALQELLNVIAETLQTVGQRLHDERRAA